MKEFFLHERKSVRSILVISLSLLVALGVGILAGTSRNAPVGKLKCTELVIVDENGNPAIVLRAVRGHGVIQLFDPKGAKMAAIAASPSGGTVMTVDKLERPAFAVIPGDGAVKVKVGDHEIEGRTDRRVDQPED